MSLNKKGGDLETCKRILYAYLFITVVKISDFETEMFGVISHLHYKMSVSPWVSYFILLTLVPFIYKHVDSKAMRLIIGIK